MIAGIALVGLLTAVLPGPGPGPNGPGLAREVSDAPGPAVPGRPKGPGAGQEAGLRPAPAAATSPAWRVPPRFPLAPDTPIAARPAPEHDRWVGPDKLKHLLMSFAVTTLGYAFGRTAGLDHRGALVAGTAAGAAAGAWKEARDRVTGGDASARDLVWDAVGVVAGGVLDAQIR